MKEPLVVLTDGSRSIPFESTVPFSQLTVYPDAAAVPEGLDSIGLAILDYADIDRSVAEANKLRAVRPSLPILFVDEVKSSVFPFYFKGVSGYGQLRSFVWRERYPEELSEMIHSILHPEYPSHSTDIAITLPAYNEETRFHNVLDFVDKLKLIMGEVFINSSVYFVNDGSVDNTEALIAKLVTETGQESRLVSQRPSVNARSLSYNTRKAGTYIEGIKSIDADILVFVDADNSFFIEDIILMINLIKEGYYDMIVGTKDFSAEDRPLVRRLLSFGKRTLTKPFLPEGVYDSQTGLKVMSSLAARTILSDLHENTGLAIDLEMLYLAKKFKFRVLQLPVRCVDREGSHVNVVKDSVAFLKTLLNLVRTTRDSHVEHVPPWNKR